MSAEVVSILVLAVMFAVGTTLSINMGVLAFAAAFLVGTVAGGMTGDEIFAGFPGDIFVVLVGVTFLFAIAKANGTIAWLVQVAVRAVGGRLAAIPWIVFAVAALLTGVGAVSPAAVAIIAPIAMGFAARFAINPLLMGLMVVHGAQAGGFSPISVYGTIVNGVTEREDLPRDEIVLFLASFAVNGAIAALVFLLFGGLDLVRRGRVPVEAADAGPDLDPDERAGRTGERVRPRSGALPPLAGGSQELDAAIAAPAERITPHQALTLAGLAALLIVAVGFDQDVGLVAISVAVVLCLAAPSIQKPAIEGISWPVVLLICGMLTYVGVLEEIGTIDYVGNAVGDISAPLLAALLLCYIGAVVSAFASSVGVLGATIPLAVPFLMQGSVDPVMMVAALAVASTVVDVSPFSTNGALVLANARRGEGDAMFRRLLRYGALVVLVAPPVCWLVFVVLGI